MDVYEHWPGDEYKVETASTPKIEDRRLIDFEPPVQEREEDKRVTIPYAFIRDELVATHIDEPWGKDITENGYSITVDAEDEITIGRHRGYGWFLALLITVNYDSMGINIFRDGELVHPTFSPQGFMKYYSLTESNHLPKLTLYSTKESKYTMAYDPPSPLHFENSIWVVVSNPDTSNHRILAWTQSIILNED